MPRLSKKEKLRRERISASLRAFWRKKKRKAKTKKKRKLTRGQKGRRGVAKKRIVKPIRKAKKRKAAPRLSRKEKLRRQRISESLKRYWAKKKKPKPVKRKTKSATIADGLEGTFAKVKVPWDTRTTSFVNSDKSVDVELRIATPPRVSERTIINRFEDTFEVKRVPNLFISTGFRYPLGSVSNPDDYEKYMGLINVQTYYQPIGRKAENLFTAREIVKNMRRIHKAKPEYAFVRLHWSPRGIRPKRPKK